MQDDPKPWELIDAVVAFLRDTAMPLLPERQAFEARVAANALEIASREITLGRTTAIAEHARLCEILGQDGDLATLNAALADGLAAGAIAANRADVRAHLWQTTLEKLAVDQPRYAAYRRAVETGSGGF